MDVKSKKKDFWHFFKRNGKIILEANLCNDNMLRINVESAFISLNLWHQRFAHRNEPNILDTVNSNSVNGLKIDSKEKKLCVPCAKAKITRNSVEKVAEREPKGVMDIVQIDYHGKLSPDTIGGKNG